MGFLPNFFILLIWCLPKVIWSQWAGAGAGAGAEVWGGAETEAGAGAGAGAGVAGGKEAEAGD